MTLLPNPNETLRPSPALCVPGDATSSPRPEEIDFEWIFDGLCHLPRWVGRARHAAGLLTVGDHTLWCLERSEDIARRLTLPHELAAGTALRVLLHDAHEAWTGDCPDPLVGRALRGVQESLDRAIGEAVDHRFGLEWHARRRWSQAIVQYVDWAEALHFFPDSEALHRGLVERFAAQRKRQWGGGPASSSWQLQLLPKEICTRSWSRGARTAKTALLHALQRHAEALA